MSFLSGLGKGLQNAFGGDQLAIAQAILAGDYQSAAALRARQSELQRQNDARDAQVIGAKNMGITLDELRAMSSSDLSRLAQARAAQRMFGSPENGFLGNGGQDGPAQPGAGASPFAPPPGAPPPDVSLASGRLPIGGGAFQSGAFPGAGWNQMLANLPRARTRAEAGSLPKGAYFLAPDASLRRIV
jgi:hypothetical protein